MTSVRPMSDRAEKQEVVTLSNIYRRVMKNHTVNKARTIQDAFRHQGTSGLDVVHFQPGRQNELFKQLFKG